MRRHALIFRLAILALATLLALPAAGQFGEDPVTWSIELSQNKGRPGDRIIAVVTADISGLPDNQGKHWHIYPRADVHIGAEASATTISPDRRQFDFFYGDVQWPEPQQIVGFEGVTYPGHEGTVRYYIPVQVASDAAPGIVAINVEVGYQACASICLMPTTESLTKVFTILEPDATAPTSREDEAIFANFDPAGFDTIVTEEGTGETSHGEGATGEESAATDQPVQRASSEPGRIKGQLFGFEYDFEGSGPAAVVLAILLAFIGGTVLNLMPCVLPIIPIKIMGLTQASDSRAKSTALGAVMLLGVVTFWIALGLAIALLSGFDSVASLFQRPLFGIGVGLFILFMAAGMMGAFAVGLPQWVYRINPKHDSPVGAFGFGVMAAVLSTPCTAPFMGAAVTWATQQTSALITMAVFAAIGVGMGWPYMVLAAFPKLVSKVPRTGPASELVKQVLGLMLIATGIFFLGSGLVSLVSEHPYLGKYLHWWVIVFVVGALAFWLSYQTFRITPSLGRRIFFTAAGLLAFIGVASFAWSLTSGARSVHLARIEANEAAGGGSDDTTLSLWAPYTPNRFAHAREDGRITVVEFTADT